MFKIGIWASKGASMAVTIALGTIAFSGGAESLPRVWGQVPPLPGISEAIAPPSPSGTEIEPVWLDGRPIFHIAGSKTSATDEGSPQNYSRLDLRVRSIEGNLYRIINADFEPNQLKVYYKILNRLPVIYVDAGKNLTEQRLLTVTTLDAKLTVGEYDLPSGDRELTAQAKARAEELTQIIEPSILRARRERQPRYLIRRGAIAGGAIAVMLAGSWGIRRWQRRLKQKQQNLNAPTESKLPANAAQAVVETTNETSSPNPEEQIESVNAVQEQIARKQLRDIIDIQQRLLQVSQVAIWVGGISITVGLFPYTRWLQPLVFSTPLTVIGVGLATYVAIRVISVLIDRFFAVLEAGEFVDARASQRIVLRISTLSPVLKSIAAFGFISVGVIVGLVILGIDVGPLLAGAGLLGLAFSFASQNLIRDAINGFLILMEDQYAVGDIIAVGSVAGLVEYMNLRMTQLRNLEGRLITVPNSSITIVENLTKDWSRVDLMIKVAYSTDPDRALEVFFQVGEQLYEDPDWHEKMVELPQVLGIDELSHDGILIRTWIKTKPLEQWSVAREFRRRLKLALDDAGISIGLPQQSLWFKNALETEKNGNGTSEAHRAIEYRSESLREET